MLVPCLTRCGCWQMQATAKHTADRPRTRSVADERSSCWLLAMAGNSPDWLSSRTVRPNRPAAPPSRTSQIWFLLNCCLGSALAASEAADGGAPCAGPLLSHPPAMWWVRIDDRQTDGSATVPASQG